MDRGALIAHFEASKSMKHVKPALDYAIDTITIEEDFLENYKFELEYGNSQCSKDAKLIASDMYYGSLQKGNFSKNRQIFQSWHPYTWKVFWVILTRMEHSAG